MVFLTGESLSGAGISCSKLAGAVSRMGLMELTARLGLSQRCSSGWEQKASLGCRTSALKVYLPLQLGKLD